MDDVDLTDGSPQEVACRVLQDIAHEATRPGSYYEGRRPSSVVQMLIARQNIVGTSVVFDEEAGGFFVWSGHRGRWVYVTESEIHGRFLAYNGMAFGTPRQNRPILQVTSARRADYLSTMREIAARPGFFSSAPPCFSFPVGTAILGNADLWVDSTPEIRCRHGLDISSIPPADDIIDAVMEVLSPHGDRVEGATQFQILLEWLGASLCGHATKLQRGIILAGSLRGGNGKSFLMNALQECFFPEMVVGFSGQVALGRDYERAKLAGKRLIVASELDQIDDMKRLGAVVTGNRMDGRRIGHDGFTFAPQAGVIWDCNELPELKRGQLGGTERRWAPLNCPNKLQGKRTESELAELIQAGKAGLIFMALAAANTAVLARAVTPLTDWGRMTISEWVEGSDLYQLFADECLVVATGQEVATADAFRAFTAWSERNRIFPIPSMIAFSRAMPKRLPEAAHRKAGNKSRGWSNVALVGTARKVEGAEVVDRVFVSPQWQADPASRAGNMGIENRSNDQSVTDS